MTSLQPSHSAGRFPAGRHAFPHRDLLGIGHLARHEILFLLAEAEQLNAFEHAGFWHPMDTLRDKNHLEALWQSGEAPWKQWA